MVYKIEGFKNEKQLTYLENSLMVFIYDDIVSGLCAYLFIK